MITQNITIYLFLPSLYHYKRLTAVHEENFQDLQFLPGAMNDAVDNVKDTTLMSYFKAVNIENNLPILPNDGRPLAQALTVHMSNFVSLSHSKIIHGQEESKKEIKSEDCILFSQVLETNST